MIHSLLLVRVKYLFVTLNKNSGPATCSCCVLLMQAMHARTEGSHLILAPLFNRQQLQT